MLDLEEYLPVLAVHSYATQCSHPVSRLRRTGKDGSQQFRCRVCKHDFSIHGRAERRARFAAQLAECYLLGLPYRLTAKTCGVSHDTVSRWFRKFRTFGKIRGSIQRM